MKCPRCKSEMVRLKDKDDIGKNFQKEFGVVYMGRVGCIKCCPEFKKEVILYERK